MSVGTGRRVVITGMGVVTPLGLSLDDLWAGLESGRSGVVPIESFASGGIELVVCALSMHHGVITPTINLESPDPDCDLDYTPQVAREAKIDVAMSNSFGFGGHNASLVLARLP